MMPKYLHNLTITICMIICWQCSIPNSKSDSHWQDDKMSKQSDMHKFLFVKEFKFRYFEQLLLKGFNKSESIKEILEIDKSGFTEMILSIDDLKLIDSLTTIDNQRMILDSIKYMDAAEGAQGKHPLEFILKKLESKTVDSLANSRYQPIDRNKWKYNYNPK